VPILRRKRRRCKPGSQASRMRLRPGIKRSRIRIAEIRKQHDAFETRASKSKATLNQVLNDLTEANGSKDHLAVKLSACWAQRVTIVANLNTTRVEKERAWAEKDQVVAEKMAAV
jgi:hypothetical protein